MNEEEVYQVAFGKLRKMFSALQLFWLVRRMEDVANSGFGNVAIRWRCGHVDEWTGGTSDKASDLPHVTPAIANRRV